MCGVVGFKAGRSPGVRKRFRRSERPVACPAGSSGGAGRTAAGRRQATARDAALKVVIDDLLKTTHGPSVEVTAGGGGACETSKTRRLTVETG